MAAREPFLVGFMPSAVREKYMMKDINPISALNQYCQVTGRLLSFTLKDLPGPTFMVQYVCDIDNHRIGVGKGATKREAKYNAGEDAMKHLWRRYMEERREDGEEDYDFMGAAAATEDDVEYHPVFDQPPAARGVADIIHAVLSNSPEAQAHDGKWNLVTRVYEYHQAIKKPFKIDSNYMVCNKGYLSIVWIDNRVAFEIYGHSKQHSRQKAAEKLLKHFIPKPSNDNKPVLCPSGKHTIYEEEPCNPCGGNMFREVKVAKSSISRQLTMDGTDNGRSEGQDRSSVPSSPSATVDEEYATQGSILDSIGEVTVSSDDAALCELANLSLGDPSQSITQTSSPNSTYSSARQTAGRTTPRRSLAAQFPRSFNIDARDGSHSAGRSIDERIRPARTLRESLSNDGSSSNDFVLPSIPLLRQSSDLHWDPNDYTLYKPMVIDVHREQIVADMLRAFEAPDIINMSIKIQFRNEAAEDADGVSREAYTAFWESFCLAHTEGNEECVPMLYTDYSGDEWEALGRILLKGYRDQTVFPLHLSVAFIVAVILGEECVDEATLLESYNHYISATEREILEKAQRQEMNEDERDDLIDFLSENGERSIPKSLAEVKNLVRNIAHKKIIQEPKYILDSMASSAREGLKLLLPMINDIREVYQRRTPCVKTVLNMLVFPETMSEQQVACSNYLKKYIRNLGKETLKKFLRFVTAADMICVHDIKVQFNTLSGLVRRPIARTCGPVLELSSTYPSFLELRAEFDSILRSGWMKMEIA